MPPSLIEKNEKCPQLLLERRILRVPINYDEKDLKANLQKVKKNINISHVVDAMTKESEVTVLPAQAQVTGYIAQKYQTFKIAEMKIPLPEALKTVTTQNWKNESHVIKEEKKI